MKTRMIKTGMIALMVACMAAVVPAKAQENTTEKPVVQEMDLADFHTLKIRQNFEVKLKQGDRYHIKATAKDGKELQLDFDNEDGVLSISKKKENKSNNVLIEIEAKTLKEIGLSGAVSLEGVGKFTTDRIKIVLSGATDLDMDVDASRVALHSSGASDVKLKGKASGFLVDISGASDVKAGNLLADTVRVYASGASSVNVNPQKAILLDISGASDLKYPGNPEILDKKISGASSVNGIEMIGEISGDTIRMKMGKKKMLFVDDSDQPFKYDVEDDDDEFESNWAGIAIGVNGYMTSSYDTKLPAGFEYMELDYPRSLSISINPWEQNFPLLKDHINLVTGFGLEFSNYRFSQNYLLMPDSSHVCAIYDSANVYKRSKLTSVWANIPLLLQFNTGENSSGNSFHWSVGVVGGIRLGSHTKQVYEIGHTKFKPKTRDDFNLNLFRYGAMFRIGYAGLDLWAKYDFSELFTTGEDPRLYPFTIGFNIGF
ncbi:MAG: DUF2807 domain-containing protein [Bacteroidetes bacterium]|nr:DUF2807 domain-containing protein [Bacteroidota bacterium]MBU1720020.1 DUF2807 domain-containing protein [Bacteroidota bacterium]